MTPTSNPLCLTMPGLSPPIPQCRNSPRRRVLLKVHMKFHDNHACCRRHRIVLIQSCPPIKVVNSVSVNRLILMSLNVHTKSAAMCKIVFHTHTIAVVHKYWWRFEKRCGASWNFPTHGKRLRACAFPMGIESEIMKSIRSKHESNDARIPIGRVLSQIILTWSHSKTHASGHW